VPPPGATYYLAPASGGGNDSNGGLSPQKPWLTPNHSVNCGDVIIAAPSTSYSASSFQTWGTVTCAAVNNVAWLECATFDGCKITGLSSGNGMTVAKSYWGVQGWEVDGTAASNYCLLAIPADSANIHHIIFANNITNGCGLSGVESGNNGDYGVDYFAEIANITYNDAGGAAECGSGVYVFQPVATDSMPGTHIYVAGNFSWANLNPSLCAGGIPTDGNGIILDTIDGRYTPGLSPYSQQIVVDNNMALHNGGRGISVVDNNIGAPVNSNIYLRHNTAWGDAYDPKQTGICPCVTGEIVGVNFDNTEMYLNLAVTDAQYGSDGYPIYAYWATAPGPTDQIDANWGYSAYGTYSDKYDPGDVFTYGLSNVFGTNPQLANPSIPGPPSCGSYSSVPACMAQVIANFTPMNAAAKGYGYQVPSSTPVYDPLFPQWLCNVNLPSGLVTMGCLAEP
jgi:hypothetical protein